MDLSIPGDNHYPLIVKKYAQERLEEFTISLVDFLVSNSLKKYNNSLQRKDNHIILAHGGKAFNEYVEKEHRINIAESFDWDVKIFVDNKVMPDQLLVISKKAITKLASIMNDTLRYMYVAPYVIFKSLMRCKTFDGFPDILKTIKLSDIKIIPKAGRRNAGSGAGIVDYVCLTLEINGEFKNILTMIEAWTLPEAGNTIDSYFNAMKKCNVIPGILLDRKRFYVSYDYLKSNIRKMISEPTYPKKQKARDRLNILENAEQNNHLTCDISNKQCNIVFDYTGNLPGFIPSTNITQTHIAYDYDFINNHPLFNTALTKYSANGYRDLNSMLLYSYFYKRTIDQTFDDNPTWNKNQTIQLMQSLDDGFDAINNRIEFVTQPFVLYRTTGFVELALESDFPINNLYGIKSGDIANNLQYISTCYTNQNSAIATFASDSQFKGCVFKITATSSKGLVIIGNHSVFSEEKEVLLDRRGSLRITNVSYKYTAETCGTSVRRMERLYIEADYLYDHIPAPMQNLQTYNVNQGPVLINGIMFADIKKRPIDDPVLEYGRTDESVENLNKQGINVFSRNDPMAIINDIRLLKEINIPDEINEPSKVIDTALGPIRVPNTAFDIIDHIVKLEPNKLESDTLKSQSMITKTFKNIIGSNFLYAKIIVIVIILIVIIIVTVISVKLSETENNILNVKSNKEKIELKTYK